MRLSISNFAWDVSQDSEVSQILNDKGIDAIDIAPGKYFPRPEAATDEDIERVAGWWRRRGIEIVGMQALLFGTSGLNVFGDASTRKRMLERLGAICRIGGRLGASRVVFGSPRNRDRSGIDDETAFSIATSFFQELGELANQSGVVICLEPNPVRYGSNFMTDSFSTAQVVRAVAHSAVRMQLDTGAFTINRESADDATVPHKEIIGHVHISEPDLLPIGEGETDHERAGVTLRKHLPNHIATVEMLVGDRGIAAETIARAFDVAHRFYGPKADQQHLSST